ncbi:MAG TPA: vitamin B12-dependent ribonucleotide reductase [Planctomycetota bacterium]|nr:vitamin B12-dependent ribonucleotide reductase [Planctomycetota bacterium]
MAKAKQSSIGHETEIFNLNDLKTPETKPSEHFIEPEFTPNALLILEKRYLRKDATGKSIETPKGMLERVAHNIASIEKSFNDKADASKLEKEFYAAMARLEFMPNSPTLMNAGRELQQLSACFVMPVGDSIDSIFETVKNAARIHKSGGGTGFSFTNIRPRNDRVSTSHGLSSGPISFMKVFNEATEAINQGGFRRGANMAILNHDHPDIIEFITCKTNEKALTNFNISVGITEDFMRRAERNDEYDLVNPRSKKSAGRLNARKVFDLIVSTSWASGEPGIVFIDRLNKGNPTPHIGAIESTNPCGEQPLLPYESCNLGSINLGKMMNQSATKPAIDWEKLRKTVHTSVRFLDNVIEANCYLLPEIEKMTKGNRKIGLGIMGFADLLIELSIPYNSESALEIAEEVMKFISLESKRASQKIAEERGAFPNFKKSVYDRPGGPLMRNATTTTIAPTGTISIIAGASSGIEPLFAVCYTRNVMDGAKLVEVHPIFEKIAKRDGWYSEELIKNIAAHNSIQSMTDIPENIRRTFVTAHDVSPEWHIKMQAAFQKYTDNAVSKTVNFPHTATRADITEAYFTAYRTNCKGVTVYRDGCRSEQVLTTGKKSPEKTKQVEETETPFSVAPRPRPEMTYGFTRKIKTGCGSLYVTVNYGQDNKPFELFSTMGKAGGCAASQSEAISRLISFSLRSGADVKEITKQLKGISCHSVAWGKNGKILSCADAISKALEYCLEGSASTTPSTMIPEADIKTVPEKTSVPADGSGKKNRSTTVMHKGACPDCGGTLSYEEGCVVCHACAYSECG